MFYLCVFSFGLTAVTMDLGEHWLFVGGANGSIAQINLFTQVLDSDVTYTCLIQHSHRLPLIIELAA